jgi:hypothetical protein
MQVGLLDGSAADYGHSADRLFNLSHGDGELLFTPLSAEDIHEELPSLDDYATPTEVADMLEQFCQLVESGKLEQYETD